MCIKLTDEECDKPLPEDMSVLWGINIYKLGFDWALKLASESNHIPHEDHTTSSGSGHYVDLLPMPAYSSSTQVYEGCFVDTSDRLLEQLMWRNNDNTVEKCIEACREANYILSGVENG